jgi:enhancing lycopene biosynthesis protein 2
MKKVAVILSGCGHLDGAEIRESVGTLWALSQAGAHFQCFAPNVAQSEVINSLTGERASKETRNILVESARIARGDIQPLNQLKLDGFDAIILPGGFGVAKNLCTFAAEGSRGTLLPALQKVLTQMREDEKPIGAICIAPALIALAFKDQKSSGRRVLELTVGPKSEVSQEIEKLGHKHFVCSVQECHVDVSNKIVSTPAYMINNAPIHHVFKGIQNLVKETLALA